MIYVVVTSSRVTSFRPRDDKERRFVFISIQCLSFNGTVVWRVVSALTASSSSHYIHHLLPAPDGEFPIPIYVHFNDPRRAGIVVCYIRRFRRPKWKQTNVHVHAREIGGACLTEVESVGRLRAPSRKRHRSAFSFSRIVALSREKRRIVVVISSSRADHQN